MAIIFIAIITIGTFISLINFIVVLKLSVSSTLKNPFFYSQILSLIGLCGLIFYGTDFFDANRHQLSITFGAGLPALLESISKVLWPVLGFILLLHFVNQILSILKNPGIYQSLAQAIFGGRSQQNADQSMATQNGTISSSPKNFDTDYQKEEYEKLKAEFDNLPSSGRIEKLLDFAIIKKMIADFESIFGVIYGTQVSALKALSKNISLDLHSFFDEHLLKQKSLLPNEKPTTYEQWEKFLIDNGLVNKEGSILRILPKGTDFLKFASQRYERVL